MTDDFAELAKRWQQQQVPAEPAPNADDLAQARQRQRRQRVLMYGEWFGALIMSVTAGWLLVAAPGWLGYLSAMFLIVGALSTLYVSWQVHRPILSYENWSSSGLLEFRRRSCELTLQHYRYTQLSCAALILFTVLLWMLRWWQWAETTTNLLLIYTLVVSPLCLWTIFRLQQKKRLKAAHMQQLAVLAKDLKGDE